MLIGRVYARSWCSSIHSLQIAARATWLELLCNHPEQAPS